MVLGTLAVVGTWVVVAVADRTCRRYIAVRTKGLEAVEAVGIFVAHHRQMAPEVAASCVEAF